MRGEALADLVGLALKLAGSAEGKSIEDVQQAYGSSRRTAERMLAVLRAVLPSMEEVPSSDRRKRWRIRDRAVQALATPGATELAALRLAVRSLNAGGSETLAAELASLGDKLDAVLTPRGGVGPQPAAAALLEAEGHLVRPGPRPVLAEDVLPTIRMAVLSSRRLRMRYAASAATVREHVVESLGVLHGPQPYLVAAIEAAKRGPALFRLDRIELTMLGDRFVAPAGFDLAAYAARSFGVWQEARLNVVLRFTGSAAVTASRFHFHATQLLSRQPDGCLHVTFTAGGRREICHHLATWGTEVEILAPVHLRREMAAWTRDLSRHHARAPPRKVASLIVERLANISLQKRADMKLWTDCTMETYYASKSESSSSPCRVRLGDGAISVMYDDDGGETSYMGTEEGAGHFTLSNADKDGKASLHMFSPTARILEGFWIEGGQEGMWRIHLAGSDMGNVDTTD